MAVEATSSTRGVQGAGSPVDGSASATGSGSGTDRAKTAGRGGIAVLGAKLFFLVVGFVQQPLLRHTVGLSSFGSLAQAQVIANTVNNIVVSSGTQGVSRAVAGARGNEAQALRATLGVHVPLAVVVALAMTVATPFYAAFEHAQDVVVPLYVLAGVALLYGLYAPLIGVLNGRNLFGRQALLDVTFATLRTAGMVGVGWWFVHRGGSGVLGITIGWVAAAAIIVPLALRWTGVGQRVAPGPRPVGVPTSGAYLRGLAPIAGAQLATNVLLVTDIALLGRFLGTSASATGLEEAAARDAVVKSLAIYKECQTFAFLPYQLLFAITLVLFPMVARARAEGDDRAVREYVARGARLAAIFCGLMVGVIAAIPGSMLSFAYGPDDAAQGADVLRVMVLGQGAFAMLGIATTVLTSVGREGLAALVTAGAVVAVGGSCWLAVPSTPFGHAQLVRTAQATAGGLAIALVVGATLVRAVVGAFVPGKTALRVGLALAVCVAIGLLSPRFGRLVTPIVAAVIAGLYLAVLVVLRELGKSDLSMIKALRGGRGGASASAKP
jgi:stage V sporulation protein B